MATEDVRAGLSRLAGNFRWVWDTPTQELFAGLAPEEWQRTGDPYAVLRAVPEVPADELFAERVRTANAALDQYLADRPGPPTVAYFCLEHGVAPALRTYSGGLGMLAGCIERTASDLALPMVAVGLRYQQWFRQRLEFGWQHEDWQRAGLDGLEPVPEATVAVDLAGDPVAVRVWRCAVGRVDLYLLDADGITDRLYGGDREHRLRQEMVLGIGGVRVLRKLGLCPTVYHANEGHAAFMGLERIRELVHSGHSWAGAVERVRGGTVFTTHTAVPAGFDLFDRRLIQKYFAGWAQTCGTSVDELMALGHFPGQPGDAPFNMAVLCTRLAGQVNSVSRLHREITEQRVLGPLWPGRAAPIVNVTNGVHPKTWTPPEFAALYEKYVGPGWDSAGPDAWDGIWNVPDDELWSLRQRLRNGLVDTIRWYLPRVLRAQGWAEDLGWAHQVLDPDALTVVVARRSAEYKEPDLLVSWPQRLRALVGDRGRPVNLLFSGLAHPADRGGKERIRRIAEYSYHPDVRARVVYLPGYDMRLARWLLHGADVWLNHPRRGDEACGTSFMKSVYSGGRILTTADGGADELIVDGGNGWIIGDRSFGVPRESIVDSAYRLLENVVVPEFYQRDGDGIPRRWLSGVKRSLASLGPAVHATNMLRAYQKMYLEAEHDGADLRPAA